MGAQHEYGAGVPRRSFLRTPFAVKKDDMDKAIAKQFEDVFKRGKKAEQALGLIGTVAVNIVKGAFLTRVMVSGLILPTLQKRQRVAARC